MEDFIVNAEARTAQGKGASRRLRREGKVPAILYGGNDTPVNLQLDGFELGHHLEHEAFFSHILSIKTASGTENAVLKDVQRHPVREQILHVDFLRVVAGQTIKMNVPVHFINESISPAVKQGGIVEHLATELEIIVLPKDLPEFIEVDAAALENGQSIHLSEVKVPKGVTLAALEHGDDSAIAVAHLARAAVEGGDDDEAVDEDGDAEGEDTE